MRLHLGRAAAIFLSLFVLSSSASAQEPLVPKYKFKKGEVLTYDVTSHLEATQVGTHPSFLQDGNDRPLSWTVNGQFENVVIDVDESGNAQLERRVRQVSSSGHVQAEKFKFSWSKEKDKEAPDESKIASLMDRFIASMIAAPTKFQVDADGNTRTEWPDFGRLVMRRGMMYWPVSSEMSWLSTEEIAIPVLHDKLKIEFRNTVTGDATRTGYKARIIKAPATLKSHAKTEGFGIEGLAFTLAGQAGAEFDMTNGRLMKLEIDLTINFSGKGQVAGGGEGNIRGVATYRETQVYKD